MKTYVLYDTSPRGDCDLVTQSKEQLDKYVLRNGNRLRNRCLEVWDDAHRVGEKQYITEYLRILYADNVLDISIDLDALINSDVNDGPAYTRDGITYEIQKSDLADPAAVGVWERPDGTVAKIVFWVKDKAKIYRDPERYKTMFAQTDIPINVEQSYNDPYQCGRIRINYVHDTPRQ